MTPSEMAAKLDRRAYVAEQIRDALLGRHKTFTWGDGQRRAWEPIARSMGATLLAKTAIERRGLRLKRGARPVGTIYYGAPISRFADVYVLECQTAPKGAVS